MLNTNQWQDFLIRTKSWFHNTRTLFQKLFRNIKECIIAQSISDLVIQSFNYPASKSLRKQVFQSVGQLVTRSNIPLKISSLGSRPFISL